MAKLKIQPLGDRVVVKPEDKKEQTKAGIIIPESASESNPKIGEVVAVGELKEIKDVKVGDKVVFSEYGYDEVEIDGQKYLIIESKKLLALVK